MDLDNIDDAEILYRVVRKSYIDGFINEEPSAALFMDDNGASVDRDGGRTESEIVENFKKRFGKNGDYINAVKISAGECRQAGTYPNPTGNHKNMYHAEIWDSETEVRICLRKAMILAHMCTKVSNT